MGHNDDCVLAKKSLCCVLNDKDRNLEKQTIVPPVLKGNGVVVVQKSYNSDSDSINCGGITFRIVQFYKAILYYAYVYF